MLTFALVGNQNCGKTTLFNVLTGSNQHVGNFPGVTVEQKIGQIKNVRDCSVVDLPGVYSLRPYSIEEKVTRDFILKEKPDGIINIIDATNIERNLYLTLQILELGVPTVIALNMIDELRGNNGTVDVEKMSETIGVPVIAISAVKNEGISELVTVAEETARKKVQPKVTDFCLPGPVHRCIHAVSHVIEDHADNFGCSRRYTATKLIEGDDADFIAALNLSENELELIEHSIVEMEDERGLNRNAALADMRYSFIDKLCSQTVVKSRESKEHRRSVIIDKVLTNKFLAIPLFILVMALVFWLTFGLIGQPLSDLLASGINTLSGLVDTALKNYGINPVVNSLIIDGIFVGVGSVVSFLPIIVVLFFFLSVLEDTGYMSRVAFVMDSILRKIGLSGRSFVPMIIGFGCTVPAVMSTRTLASERDRKMTVLLTPYMSCSAKIPIYAVFSTAFFHGNSALVMTALYVTGLLVGVIVALILNKTVYKGNSAPFIMELPNYRLPSAKSVLLLLWEKAKDFLKKAFTVIFVGTVVIWFLGSFDAKLNYTSDSSLSLLAMIGKIIAPVFSPVGFGDWRAATSLISGLIAKESVVSTLAVLTSTTVDTLAAQLASVFGSVLSAVSFLLFTLLYTPCIAAIATVKNELKSSSKAIGVVIFQCAIAWIVSFAVYSIGGLF